MRWGLDPRCTVAGAYDQDREANATYLSWHKHVPYDANLTTVQASRLARHGPAGWLMSPPCQPYTVKGRGQDEQDPRARALLNLVEIVPQLRPPFLFLENVPPFQHSNCRNRLVQTLEQGGLQYRELTLCPTDLGIPNRRHRYYLLAAPRLLAQPPVPTVGRPLAEYLDDAPDPALDVCHFTAEQRHTLDIVRDDQPAACFGSSYGRARTRSGSYLEDQGRLRRFSPTEILRLLHFPGRAAFAKELPIRRRYALAGNSVNVAVVSYLLKWLLDSYSSCSP